jgi:mRNA interferase RelE/StbE
MMNYKIIFTPNAEKQLDKIDIENKTRIIDGIIALGGNPRTRGCAKLKGFDRLYRIRAGDFRVIYEVDDGERTVIVAIIKRREKDTYRDL